MKAVNKTIFFLVSILFFAVINIYAQKKVSDTVYLKNGSIIHGIVTEIKPNESIKITTQDGNIFVYKMEEVEKVELGKSKSSDAKHSVSNINKQPYSGICMGLEASIGPAIGSNKESVNSSVSGHFFAGYMNNSIYMFGINAGINLWNIDYQYSDMPVVLDFNLTFRVFPMKNKITPLFLADLGYAMVPEPGGGSGSSSQYGMTFNLGAGIRMNENAKRGYTLAICYKNQQYESNFNYNYNNNYNYPEPLSGPFEAICLQLGISF